VERRLIDLVVDRLKAPFSQEARGAMKELLVRAEYSGLGETIGSLWKTFDYLILTEMEHKRGRFAGMLERSDAKKKHEKREEAHHVKSIAQIERTLKAFRKERKKLDKKKIQEMDALSKILEEIYDKAVKDRGASGVLDYIEHKLDELKRIRSETNRGREHRSPAVWKAVAIGVYLGACLGLVLWCWAAAGGRDVIIAACLKSIVGAFSDNAWWVILLILAAC